MIRSDKGVSYYQRIFKDSLIVDPSLINGINVDRNTLKTGRSEACLVTIHLDGKDPIELVEKTLTSDQRARFQFPNADLHEAAVLRAITGAYPLLQGQRTYTVPTFIHHESNGRSNTIITRYVPGELLSDRLDGLNEKAGELEKQSKRPGKRGLTARRKIKRINAVKIGFLYLGVHAISELVYDLRDRFQDPIKAQLEAAGKDGRRIDIYNPLRRTQGYYEGKFTDNLEVILSEHVTDQSRTRKTLGNLRKPVEDESHVLYPIKEYLASSTVNGNIILSDCHPGQIKVLPDYALEDRILNYIVRGKTNEDALAEIQDDIIKHSNVAVIDLGDLRLGHELLDFTDFSGHHSFALLADEMNGALFKWTQRRQSLIGKPEDTYRQNQRYQDEFPLIAVYRLIRQAAKSEEPAERRFYISRAMYYLEVRGLQPLKDLIRPRLAEAQGDLRKKMRQSN